MKYLADDLIENRQWQANVFQRLGVKMIRSGEVPRHIGIIMDGNRRWAKEREMSPIYGHIEGVRTLDKVFHFADAIGVKEITAYALSTDNLKRSKEEVKGLMDLMTAYWKRQIENMDNLRQRGFRYHAMGDIEMLPKSVRALAAKVSCLMYDNKSTRLNLAICYKSSEEIDRAMNIIKQGVNCGDILLSDIDENLVNNCLYTNKSNPVDFLIRTSGEQRFSDFFLWQANRVPLYFCDVLWPTFSFFNFFKAMLYYQRTVQSMPKAERKESLKNNENANEDKGLKQERIEKFLLNEENKLKKWLDGMAEDANDYL